jgi:hypothetical protein
MKYIVLILLGFFLCSCGSHQGTIIKGAEISLPDPKRRPPPIATEDPNIPKEKGITYIEAPKALKSNETWTAPKGGAVILSSPAWQTLKYGLTRWRAYAEELEELVVKHNEIFNRSTKSDNKSWWK